MTETAEAERKLLQSHVDWLRGDHELCNPWLADIIETIAAERDALREALWCLVDACETCDWDDAFLDEARAALNREAE